MKTVALNMDILKKSIFKGILAAFILLSIYFLVLTLISGWNFTLEQFSQFWYYIISLALGFGIQLSLYSYLKGITEQQLSSGQLVATGTTSTATMISCCAHHLTNVLPILGIAGVATFITQYQVQFFWVGLIFNLFGILYIGNKVVKVIGLKINNVAVVYAGLITVILLFFLLNSVSKSIGSQKTADTKTSLNTTAVASSKFSAQENDDASIAVSVTPENLDSNPSSWDFNVTINNHQVSIDNDLVADSELLDDQGKSYKPTSWDGSAPGGHHRDGVLKFSPISPKPKFIELKIKNIGGIAERSFKWSL